MESTYEMIQSKENLAKLKDVLSKPIVPVVNVKRKPTKVYFAAPWFNQYSATVYNFVQHTCKNLSDDDVNVYFPRDNSVGGPKKVFEANKHNIQNCDFVLAWIDEKDVGTAWEIGYAYALDKPVVLMGLDETTFSKKTNLMLAFTGRCITIRNIKKLLLNMIEKSDYVDISKKWEDIE